MLLDENSQIWDADEFENESELEASVFDNYQLLYGNQSLLFGKNMIKTESGVGTIPDAFVVDIENREWSIVEVELLRHRFYSHIVPQITKQVNAANTIETKNLLRQQFVAQIQSNRGYLQTFEDAEIPEIQIAGTLGAILNKPPKISIPIDKSDTELELWAKSLQYEVKIMEIVRFKNRDTGAKLLQLPDLKTNETIGGQANPEKGSRHSLRGSELIFSLVEADLLKIGSRLTMKYEGQEFEATITSIGLLKLTDGTEHSSSGAAAHCMRTKTANGLILWKTEGGKSLRKLRDELAVKITNEAV